MASLGEFSAMKEKYSQLVDFVTIYIEEAHPAERGHFSGNIPISTHPHMEARVEAAKNLKEDAGAKLEGCSILVDPMDNRANMAYAAFPERLYVVLDGKIVFVGGTGPANYDVRAVDEFLSKSLNL